MEDTTLTSKLMVDLLSENVPLITEETEFKSSIGISPSKIPDPITYADKIGNNYDSARKLLFTTKSLNTYHYHQQPLMVFNKNKDENNKRKLEHTDNNLDSNNNNNSTNIFCFFCLEKDSIKAVSGKLGMSTNNIVHNKSKQQVDTIPQCTASRFYSCGWCGFGCKYDEKQSAMITWLLDAKNQGAKRLEDCA
ncbi:13355_t:CDS:2 [Entrophospora sp. SA101]|nr:13355_t:CDS:2 [Entrophospora sp. SA101]